jgi:hypothetical protein
VKSSDVHSRRLIGNEKGFPMRLPRRLSATGSGVITIWMLSQSAHAAIVTCGNLPCMPLAAPTPFDQILKYGTPAVIPQNSLPVALPYMNIIGDDTASVNMSGTPNPIIGGFGSGPVVSVAANHGNLNNGESVTALGSLSYQFEVVCTLATCPSNAVNVTFFGNLSATASGALQSLATDHASAVASWGDGQGTTFDSESVTADTSNPSGCASVLINGVVSFGPVASICSPAKTYQFTQTNVDVGAVGEVDIATDAFSLDGNPPSGIGSASATSDPSIYIDPSTPDADLYAILVSPGISNAAPNSTGTGSGTPVPEPWSFVMLLTGLVGLALVRFPMWVSCRFRIFA